MTETTAGATIETTATGHPSAPILAREAGVNPVDYMRSRGFVYDISDETGLRELFEQRWTSAVAVPGSGGCRRRLVGSGA